MCLKHLKQHCARHQGYGTDFRANVFASKIDTQKKGRSSNQNKVKHPVAVRYIAEDFVPAMKDTESFSQCNGIEVSSKIETTSRWQQNKTYNLPERTVDGETRAADTYCSSTSTVLEIAAVIVQCWCIKICTHTCNFASRKCYTQWPAESYGRRVVDSLVAVSFDLSTGRNLKTMKNQILFERLD